jgi:hypothetical protein
MSLSFAMKPAITEQENPPRPSTDRGFSARLILSLGVALLPFAFAYLSEAGYFEESFGDLPFLVALFAPVVWLVIYTNAVIRDGYRAFWMLVGAPLLCQPYYSWIYLAVVSCYLQGSCS